jgi:TatA/E family protein of Tat protein translocase
MALVQANIFSPQDLLLILLIALLFFGGKKLPEIGSSLGQAMREFRRTTDEWDQPAPSERPQAVPGDAAPRALGTPAPSSPPAAEAPKHEPEAPGTRV